MLYMQLGNCYYILDARFFIGYYYTLLVTLWRAGNASLSLKIYLFHPPNLK